MRLGHYGKKIDLKENQEEILSIENVVIAMYFQINWLINTPWVMCM